MVASFSVTKVPLASSVEEMWPAFKNAVTLIAQHCPQFIQSCELLHGDGGLGSIRLVKFGPASGLVTFAKEEIVEVDEEKMVLTYLLLEGDLKKQFKVFKPSISLEKIATTSETGLEQKGVLEEQYESVATWRLEYEVAEGTVPPQIELLNEGAKMFFKLLETSAKASQTQANINFAKATQTQTIVNPSTHLPIKEDTQTPVIV